MRTALWVFVKIRILFYLTGVDQEETILLVFPGHPDEKFREVLFVRETNELIAVWEGEKLSKEQAREVSGIQTIYWTHQYETVFRNIVYEAENVYLNSNEHTRNDSPVITRDARFVTEFKEKYPLHHACEACAYNASASCDQTAAGN